MNLHQEKHKIGLSVAKNFGPERHVLTFCVLSPVEDVFLRQFIKNSLFTKEGELPMVVIGYTDEAREWYKLNDETYDQYTWLNV